MNLIPRDHYLNQLISKRENGLIKVITGIRRCGKSTLLDPIFKNYLIESGVSKDQIIKVELDRVKNRKFHHDPDSFDAYLHSFIKNDGMYYVLLDEIQLVDDFESVLNGFLYERNVDVYVTGSNSKFLSSDIITEFRGRGDPVYVSPLTFSEFCQATSMDKRSAWKEYLMYGGMPFALSIADESQKMEYLKNLFKVTYIKDIVERYAIRRPEVMETIENILASSVGSLTNPQRIYDTFRSHGDKELSLNTINAYMKYIEDSFLVKKAQRYDIKGRKYIQTPQKYYFTDLGLRNARLNFRQYEETHLMENAIFNELIYRGYNVDIGVVETRQGDEHVQTEVDFVCNQGYNRYYIQSALTMATMEKMRQESRPLNNIQDSFKKIIVVADDIPAWRTDDGILVMNVIDFLLDEKSLQF